ncbi:MAG: methionyl-tRNA formyltransferase, partial [Bacteroidales bacterium]|nr:methionyl-tRNA formyltransferase [Bacteroidales bacterium]
PDRAAGRGLKISESDVKKAAKELNLNILQPKNLKDTDFLNQLKNLNAELFVVVAFRMLPVEVWKMPEKGTINIHASLLPNYRGAAPINHAIINGEKITGVTSFFINENIDTGDIIAKSEIEISENDTAGSLHDKLMSEGANLLAQTVNEIQLGQNKLISQSSMKNSDLKPAPKIFREDCKINWNLKGEQIRNFVRGLNPYPGAFTSIILPDNSERNLKIHDVSFLNTKHNFSIGQININQEENTIQIAVADGFINIHKLQLEGKKAMSTEDFLRGFNFNNVYLKI